MTLSLQTQNKVRKQVSFYPKARVQRIYSNKEITKEEKSLLWYNVAEFRQIRNEVSRTVRLMERDPNFIEDEVAHCTRGLETYTKLGRQLAREIRGKAIDVVMDGQELNWNEEMIAECYNNFCAESQVLANLIANMDEEAMIESLGKELDDWLAADPFEQVSKAIKHKSEHAVHKDKTLQIVQQIASMDIGQRHVLKLDTKDTPLDLSRSEQLAGIDLSVRRQLVSMAA